MHCSNSRNTALARFKLKSSWTETACIHFSFPFETSGHRMVSPWWQHWICCHMIFSTVRAPDFITSFCVLHFELKGCLCLWELQNRIMKWFRQAGSYRDHPLQPPGRSRDNERRLTMAQCSQVLSLSEDRHPTASLGTLFQCYDYPHYESSSPAILRNPLLQLLTVHAFHSLPVHLQICILYNFEIFMRARSDKDPKQ